MPGGKRPHGDDFNSHFGGTFVFREPEEVFKEVFGEFLREFLDGKPLQDIFADFQPIDFVLFGSLFGIVMYQKLWGRL
ncbi:PREDICTED: dnaJ homolog subfamily B member 3-like [Vollenhovia emeryi]|uniref:dnaJ homolog subfamily B member 3-like n=1 Tax=Vollenhovia emeryi TaxID=411798 RepID=UPI0005F4604D|nr:PREDICTED: dnaJ homolog subfamily B member 3-like [Vollenhovia emeryi]